MLVSVSIPSDDPGQQPRRRGDRQRRHDALADIDHGHLRTADADKLLGALPADAATAPIPDWGFALQLAQWHRRAGRINDAATIPPRLSGDGWPGVAKVFERIVGKLPTPRDETRSV